MTGVDKRLGYTGADEIKRHPFFKNVDWKNIRKSPAPFIPEVSIETLNLNAYFIYLNLK